MAATFTVSNRDGFDHQLAADYGVGHTTGSGTRLATASTRFNYGYGISSGFTILDALGSLASWRVCGSFKRIVVSGSVYNIAKVIDVSTEQAKVAWRSDGFIDIYANGSVVATSASSYTLGDWHWFCCLFTINNTTGAVLVYIDNILAVSFSGNTRATGNNYGTIGGFDESTGAIAADDYHIDAGTGLVDSSNVLLDSRIYTSFALTQGDYADFLPDSGSSHTARISDSAGMDGDTSYIEANSAGNREAIYFDDLPTDAITINDMTVVAAVRKTDAGSRTVKLGTRYSAVNTDDVAQSLLSTFSFLRFTQKIDPNTTGAWTRLGVNRTQGMVKVES